MVHRFGAGTGLWAILTLASLLLLPGVPALAAASAPAASAPAPSISFFQQDQVVLEHRWGAAPEANGTFALLAGGSDAANITFALREDLVDPEQDLRIPWRSVTITGPTAIRVGRIASFTATVKDIPGPGTYPFTLYAQADQMERPAALKLELRVLPGPRLASGDRSEPTQMVSEDIFELRFTAESPGRTLRGVKFAMSGPVTAEEDPTKSLLPTHVRVLTRAGGAAPTTLPESQPAELVLRARVPGPGTYRIPLTLTAPTLAQPVTETYVLTVPGAQMSDHPNGYVVETVTTWPNRWLAAVVGLFGWVEDALGTRPGEPCDGDLVTFREQPPGLAGQVPVEFSAFADSKRQVNLTEGRVVLYPLDGNCGVEAAHVEFLPARSTRSYVLHAVRRDPVKPIRAGSYTGQMLAGSGSNQQPLQVTVHVKHGLVEGFLAILLGLLCNWLMILFHARSQQEPYTRRLTRVLARLGTADPSPLATAMANWTADDLKRNLLLTDVDRELTLLEQLINQAEYVIVRKGLDQEIAKLPPDRTRFWESLRSPLSGLPQGATPDLIQSTVQAALEQEATMAQISPASEPAGPQPTGAAALQLRLTRAWSSVNGWLFIGAETLGIKVMRAAIFLVSLAVVVYPAVETYKTTADFGADLLGDYGPLFMLGFAGKAFNNALLRISGAGTPQQ